MSTVGIVEQLKDYYLTKKYECKVFQFFALVIAFFVPIFGYALTYADPFAIEYYSHRYLIAGYWLLILGLSFKIKVVKKYMAFFAALGTYIFMFWIVWIVQLNHFSPEYTIGFFLSFCGTGIVFRNRLDLGTFIFTILLTTIIVILTSPHLEVEMSILILSMIAIGMVYFIVMEAKSYMTNQLETLNRTLEEKVMERTQLAEDRAKALVAKNLELENFAYVASHDLKAPLRTISSFVTLLSRKTRKLEDKNLQEYTQFIIEGTTRMNETIDNLLDYSRIGSGNMKLKPVNLNHVMAIVLNGLNSLIHQSTVKLNLPTTFPEQVICETAQIQQLFQNLIENALKFNQSKLKIVTISYEEQPDLWAFSVQDNGIGISEQYIDQIFDMFKRLHTYDTFPGTGIGLATCKRIVENHGGSISVKSKLGEGTTFHFTIAKPATSEQNLISPKVLEYVEAV